MDARYTRRSIATRGIGALMFGSFLSGCGQSGGCGPDCEAFDYGYDFQPAPDRALAVLGHVMGAAGLKADIRLFGALFKKSPIAYATIRQGETGQYRAIVYDRAFLHWDSRVIGWYEVTILAHEVGHLLAGHVLRQHEPVHDKELEADYFAGFIVARLGGSKTQATRAASLMPRRTTHSHPAHYLRIGAIEAGWQSGVQA